MIRSDIQKPAFSSMDFDLVQEIARQNVSRDYTESITEVSRKYLINTEVS